MFTEWLKERWILHHVFGKCKWMMYHFPISKVDLFSGCFHQGPIQQKVTALLSLLGSHLEQTRFSRMQLAIRSRRGLSQRTVGLPNFYPSVEPTRLCFAKKAILSQSESILKSQNVGELSNRSDGQDSRTDSLSLRRTSAFRSGSLAKCGTLLKRQLHFSNHAFPDRRTNPAFWQ